MPTPVISSSAVPSPLTLRRRRHAKNVTKTIGVICFIVAASVAGIALYGHYLNTGYLHQLIDRKIFSFFTMTAKSLLFKVRHLISSHPDFSIGLALSIFVIGSGIGIYALSKWKNLILFNANRI